MLQDWRALSPQSSKSWRVILGAENKLYALEYELYSSVRDKIAGEVGQIQQTAKAMANLDVFASLPLWQSATIMSARRSTRRA